MDLEQIKSNLYRTINFISYKKKVQHKNFTREKLEQDLGIWLEKYIVEVIASSVPEDTFTADIPVVLPPGVNLGPYVNGDVIPAQGLTFEEFSNLIATSFLAPAFTSFSTGLPSVVEVGTTVGPNSTFTWGTSNPTNIQAASISIEDVTGSSVLVSGLANDGSELVNIGVVVKNTETSNTWRINLIDTEAGTANSTRATAWSYIQFYGPVATIPIDSATVRALPDNRFNNASNNFILNTGSTEVTFTVAVPQGKTISQVIDLDALNTDITSQYISQGVVSVLDAGGANVNYEVFAMVQAVPYTSNHRHSITLS